MLRPPGPFSSPRDPPSAARRKVLGSVALLLGGTLAAGWWQGWWRLAAPQPGRSSAAPPGAGMVALLPPDALGLRLPEGVTARIVARSGERPLAGSDYRWHGAPDGGACFPTPDGGWVYVSNSELPGGQGGVGALRFDAAGTLRDAYPILHGTTRNCAGGATPWGTWLSCEEIPGGRVWECDPLGGRPANLRPAAVRPALGVFSHEAVAVDPERRQLYLTEDEPDGRLYRFTPRDWPSLEAGRLEVARVLGRAERLQPGDATLPVEWLPLPDPAARRVATRAQVPESTPFRGGEGIAWHRGAVVFSTKGDDRLWRLEPGREPERGALAVLYDAATAPDPVLTGVDNVLIDRDGAVLVAEDGGDMQIVALLPFGGPQAIVQVEGQPRSEITGLAFSPAYERFYFSSQRGPSGLSSGGITYELRGPVPRGTAAPR